MLSVAEKFRSKREIEKEIREIEAEKARLPEFSFFGDNNWATMDAQIEILKIALARGKPAIIEISDEIEENMPESFGIEYDLATEKLEIIAWLLSGGRRR